MIPDIYKSIPAGKLANNNRQTGRQEASVHHIFTLEQMTSSHDKLTNKVLVQILDLSSHNTKGTHHKFIN